MSELFDGFLTLGLDQNQFVSEPETPTFVMENVAEIESRLNVKIIDKQSAKMLNADTDDRFYQETSSAGSSHVGITIAPKKRPSLGEMLQRTKVGEKKNCENSRDDYLKRDSAGGSFKTTRKFLKWRMLKCCTLAANSVTAEKKLQKVVKIFSRKVYPAFFLVVTKISQKSHKNEYKNTSGVPSYDSNYYNLNNAARSMTEEAAMSHSHRAQRNKSMAKDRILCSSSFSNSSPLEIKCSFSRGSSEYWDKTDPNYLVLEL